jgi:3-phenylpropionate/cinnamic acid dioxygenase small subunit
VSAPTSPGAAPGDDGEIRSLIALLAQRADLGEVDDYVALFVEDAVWALPAIPQTGLAASERHGRGEIEAGVRERRAAGVQGPGTDTAHVVTSTIVSFEAADRAVAESTWMFLGETSTSPRILTFGRYRDTVCRTADGWRVARREIVLG